MLLVHQTLQLGQQAVFIGLMNVFKSNALCLQHFLGEVVFLLFLRLGFDHLFVRATPTIYSSLDSRPIQDLHLLRLGSSLQVLELGFWDELQGLQGLFIWIDDVVGKIGLNGVETLNLGHLVPSTLFPPQFSLEDSEIAFGFGVDRWFLFLGLLGLVLEPLALIFLLGLLLEALLDHFVVEEVLVLD